MRTTINLEDHLLREAKAVAARSGISLNAFVEGAVREALARRQQPAARQPIRIPTQGGNGLRPGIDLDDSAALLDLLDGR